MKTKDALIKVIPTVESDNIEQIDEEIRRFIASVEGEIFSQTVEYIEKKIGKYYRYSSSNLKKKCKKLAKKYLKNENAWMSQTNIFCFLALFYSCISLIMRVVQEITAYTTFISDIIQVVLLLIVLGVFVLLCKNGKVYDNSQFNKFLKEFNRTAPSITIMVSLLFYLVLVAWPMKLENIKYLILFIIAGCMILPIVWAYERVKNKEPKKNTKRSLRLRNIIKDKLKKIIKYAKKSYHFMKKILWKMYQVISVISTLTIFTGVIYFVSGKVTSNNQSDNDLIMLQIKEEICENQEIINIEAVDIHGFGNNSIIVTTGNDGGDEDNNRLIILESVENEILQSMNDLFGLKSSYRTTFTYGLKGENMCLYPVINSVSDIIGDSTKEILINYYVWGSTYDAYYTAIFKYSYEDERYEIIGTYPIAEKTDHTKYDKQGNIIYNKAMMVETKFDDVLYEGKDVYEFSDLTKTFNLTSYSAYCRDYWAEFSNMGRVLVVVKREKYCEEALVDCYLPSYEEKERNLRWNKVYSENTIELPENYTKDDLARWMEEQFNCNVNMY